MRIHTLQHVSFEGLATITNAIARDGHQLTTTHLYLNQTFPSVNDYDCLIVLGGPMGIYDEHSYPWLFKEKQFIRHAIDAGKIVLGICLGAQLIADALGAKVYNNKEQEIGWFEVEKSVQIEQSILASVFPHKLDVFHWHGDTFDIPDGAKLIASSEACKHQGFVWGDRVIALQFHMEVSKESVQAMLANCDAGGEATYIQPSDDMLKTDHQFEQANHIMMDLFESLTKLHVENERAA